ncbi:MAG: hypothetical protein JSW27_08325 [Phycisphaerales bacterium]|nr:MAG: hypothetical protein JSW27_08325 [Phycisphaerales bacterium]
MKRKSILAIVGSFLISGLLGPPDAVTQTVYGLAGAILCAITFLILSRCKFVRSSSKQMQMLICVIVCMISVLAVHLPGLLFAGSQRSPDTNYSAASQRDGGGPGGTVTATVTQRG